MGYNPDSDEVMGKPLSVYKDKQPDTSPNKLFCDQMGKALVDLGTEEALSCMARMMCAVASNQGVTLEFDCDLGSVNVKPKSLPQTH